MGSIKAPGNAEDRRLALSAEIEEGKRTSLVPVEGKDGLVDIEVSMFEAIFADPQMSGDQKRKLANSFVVKQFERRAPLQALAEDAGYEWTPEKESTPSELEILKNALFSSMMEGCPQAVEILGAIETEDTTYTNASPAGSEKSETLSLVVAPFWIKEIPPKKQKELSLKFIVKQLEAGKTVKEIGEEAGISIEEEEEQDPLSLIVEAKKTIKTEIEKNDKKAQVKSVILAGIRNPKNRFKVSETSHLDIHAREEYGVSSSPESPQEVHVLEYICSDVVIDLLGLPEAERLGLLCLRGMAYCEKLDHGKGVLFSTEETLGTIVEGLVAANQEPAPSTEKALILARKLKTIARLGTILDAHRNELAKIEEEGFEAEAEEWQGLVLLQASGIVLAIEAQLRAALKKISKGKKGMGHSRVLLVFLSNCSTPGLETAFKNIHKAVSENTELKPEEKRLQVELLGLYNSLIAEVKSAQIVGSIDPVEGAKQIAYALENSRTPETPVLDQIEKTNSNPTMIRVLLAALVLAATTAIITMIPKPWEQPAPGNSISMKAKKGDREKEQSPLIITVGDTTDSADIRTPNGANTVPAETDMSPDGYPVTPRAPEVEDVISKKLPAEKTAIVKENVHANPENIEQPVAPIPENPSAPQTISLLVKVNMSIGTLIDKDETKTSLEASGYEVVKWRFKVEGKRFIRLKHTKTQKEFLVAYPNLTGKKDGEVLELPLLEQ